MTCSFLSALCLCLGQLSTGRQAPGHHRRLAGGHTHVLEKHSQPSAAQPAPAPVSSLGSFVVPGAGGAHRMPLLLTEKGLAPSTLPGPTKEGIGDGPALGGLLVGPWTPQTGIRNF